MSILDLLLTLLYPPRCPSCARDLHRASRTPAQATLGRGARGANVRAAFTATDPGTLRGRSVLLVDDVLTTGATARECAAVLRAAGARVVDVWTLARTPRPLS